jgi:predicted CoA-substrate-specific enzyme activase
MEAALDIGSVGLKAAALRPDGSLAAFVCRPIRGRLQSCLGVVLEELAQAVPTDGCVLTAVTGARADAYARLLGVREISSIMAAYRGVCRLVPHSGAALELGGEHSTFLRFSPPTESGGRLLEDFAVNGACSAGTGAFLEQEAHRFGLSIDEFGRHAAASRRTVQIAGRCAVFAKTDLVHKHQNGIPLDDLAYALCLAIAQSIAGELIGAVPFRRPLVLVGGVAANRGMQRAVKEALKLEPHELVVPSRHESAGAFGAVVAARGYADPSGLSLSDAIARVLTSAPPPMPRVVLEPLSSNGRPRASRVAVSSPTGRGLGDGGVMGIDIGSTSTNLGWLDADGEVRETRSVPTRGDPLTAVADVLRTLEARHGAVSPSAVGVTGSGRRLVAEMIGADFAVNEITAHAAGCTRFFPNADAVFDIGGQDAKYIRLAQGAVVGFEMNKVCSAGTGSFLEEMATLLGIDIVGEFGEEALRSRAPIELGERCTVFVGSEIARRLQEGCAREDLAAGLAYAVVRNYLGRVVGCHPQGTHIVFQGGVAANTAVVAALRSVLGRDVTVHPFNDAAGAIGVALLARRHVKGPSRFRSSGVLDLTRVRTRGFSCQRCSNRCTVHVTQGPSRRRFFAGGLCDRYEGRGDGKRSASRPDLFAERDEAIARRIAEAPPGSDGVVGIPRALLFHEQLPFWTAFLGHLGVPYVLSLPTTRQMLERGAALARRGTCLPLTFAYGHVAELVAAGVRRILLPSMASLSDCTVAERLDHVCPAVQGWPYTTRALVTEPVEFLIPRLRLSLPHIAEQDIVVLGRQLGATAHVTQEAFAAGCDAQAAFRDEMLRRGDEVLAERRSRRTAVILARPYTVCDPQVRLRLTRVLDDVGITGVPMEMVRDEPLASGDLHGMYWYYGKRLLQTAQALRRLGDVAAISLSSFRCGPDSFILHMLRRELGDVPTLELEVDEHSEFNGIHTRVEAFRWTLGSRRAPAAAPPAAPGAVAGRDLNARRLYIPYMSDHALAFAAAFRSCDVDAEVLPLPDEESVALGRAALDGGECLPCAFVLGDMLRHLKHRRPEDPAPAFFMIAGDGPCRLGQYPWLQRAVLDERGHADVPIFNASQDPEFYEKFGMVPAAFQRRAWDGTVATDLLFRKWRECRARACDRAEADARYREELGTLAAAVERGAPLPRVLRRAFDRFEDVPVRNGRPPVTIGLLGENYVRCNAAANASLADMLEELGAEVWYPSLCEWVLYTNWTARLHCRYERQTKRRLLLRVIDALQRFEMARLTRAVRGRLANAAYPPVTKLFQLAAPYVPDTFEGETIVGIGRTIDLFRQGVGGVIHVSPFGCMVGGIVEALCGRVSADLGGFPILHLQYDGRRGEHTHGLLEGFVMRARVWQEGRGATARTS